MTNRIMSRAEVTFEVRQDSEGRPFVGLILTKDGKPAAGDRLFTFDVLPELAPEEIETLVDVLNRCITHLGMAIPQPEDTEGQGG